MFDYLVTRNLLLSHQSSRKGHTQIPPAVEQSGKRFYYILRPSYILPLGVPLLSMVVVLYNPSPKFSA